MLPVAGAALAAVALKLHASRPRFHKEFAGPYSVPESAAPGAPFRRADKPELATVPFEGCDTIYATFQYATKRNGTRRAVGTRALLQTETATDAAGRPVEKLRLAPAYTWLTYDELAERTSAFGAGLVALAGLKAHDKVVIYADTRAEWQVAAQGAFRQNATVVTVYSTLGEEGVQHGVSQTRASIIVCDAKLLKVLLAVAPACPALRHVITIGEVPAALTARLPPGCIATTMDAVLALGRANPCAPSPPAPTDTAVIMYTSGTTGPPKGVVLNHANVCASMAGLVQAARFTAADVYLAYLPLAHIMELTSECVMFALGCAVGYGSPQTLTDSGLKLAPGCRGDAPTLRPTFMVFAPTVLDRVRQTVDARMAAAKPLKRRMAGLAMAAGFRDFARGRIGAPPLWNALVFKKVQALIGGRVKLMICGSAPLSAETQRFAQTAFNCPVRQGYGLTETCSAATVGAFDDNAWSVGRVLSSCKVKLLDWEEGNYRNADAADPAIRMPRGEILVGGPCVAQGYYNDPESPDPEIAAKNVSDFSVSADGTRYFHTGDIGQFTASGMLQIIDRKKDLVKLQMGEYVALSKVENAMKLCPLVESALCYAQPSKSHVVALVVPNEPALRRTAAGAAAGAETPLAALCANAAVVAEVLAAVKAAVKGKLLAFETPARIALLPTPWTPENDMVTAAMKLKRVNIVAANKASLDAIYA